MSSPRNMCRRVAMFFTVLTCIFFVGRLHAYPDAEVTGTGTGYPPFDFSATAPFTGFLLISDSQLVMSFGESLKLADMGSYSLEADQPPALSDTAGNSGAIVSIGYSVSQNEIVAAQADGDVIFFELDDITANPLSITLNTGDELGAVAVDPNGNTAFVGDNTAKKIYMVDLVNRTSTATAEITNSGSFTDGVFIEGTGESYFTTTGGNVYYLKDKAVSAAKIEVAASVSLSTLAVTPAGDFIYCVNGEANDPSVYKISTASHAVVKTIVLEYNSTPTDAVITEASNYSPLLYIAGGEGVSVVNTGDDSVMDFDAATAGAQPIPVSATVSALAASSAADGYVYLGYSTSRAGIITANPFVAITVLTLPEGVTSLGRDQSFTLTFNSNEDGTYEAKAQGGVTADGNLLTDSLGATSGTVTAATDTAPVFNYNDNSSAFAEGDNDIWVFVTGAGGRGRRAATLSVDTPPPNVTMDSVGFGNERIYVQFRRLEASDLATYNIYVDPDGAAVLTKEAVTAAVAQTASGATITANIAGLANGTLYYVAMEAVDTAGNKSTSRTNTLADGQIASGLPEQTAGPAQLLGEKGMCAFVPFGELGAGWAFVLASAICIVFVRMRFRSSSPF